VIHASLRETREERIPYGWQRVELVPTDPKPTEFQPPAIVRVPLRRFRSDAGAVEASRPVEIRFVQQDEDSFLAESETLTIYASGETIEAALSDFIDQVVYFFGYYRGLSADEVIGDASRLRRLYLQEFREVITP